MAERPMIELSGVRRSFADGVVLDGLDLRVDAGEFVSLVGPSGCGKSTLLRLVAGLDQADGGEVVIAREAGLAYVFQDAHLLPWRTVEGNVALPLELAGERDVQARVSAALTAVELAGVGHKYPAELSGGMRMRASIARALVTRPRLLLMDEPFAALDELTRQRLDERLRTLFLEQGLTVVFVTHSIAEATFLSTRVVVLSSRPARIVHDGPVDLPAERNAVTRGTPAFARVTADLVAALEEGEA
ncbi:MAG: ABC transporter ATP-binding protein [Myxococcales bacterium]|nr:ABC transporter ATP-binding protein [Myxococcales bacterium]